MLSAQGSIFLESIMFKLTQPSSDGEIESATNSEASSHLNISTVSQSKDLHIVFPNTQLLH